MKEERKSANGLLIALALFFFLVLFAMYSFGKDALKMKPEFLELNALMTERTHSCAEPVNPQKCRNAINALTEYEEKLKNRTVVKNRP